MGPAGVGLGVDRIERHVGHNVRMPVTEFKDGDRAEDRIRLPTAAAVIPSTPARSVEMRGKTDPPSFSR